MSHLWISLLVCGLLISLNEGDWTELAFRGVKPNKVSSQGEALKISVNDSASPLVRVYAEAPTVKKVVIEGRIEGRLELAKDQRWRPGWDDAYLRVGVITPGDQRLTVAQRFAAPEWLRQMDALFAESWDGVGDIQCALLVPHADWVGASRVRPDAALFREFVAGVPDAEGRFRIEMDFASPLIMAGLWLLADGDDTGARFTVWIDRIRVAAVDGG